MERTTLGARHGGKEPPASAAEADSVPESVRCPGEGNGAHSSIPVWEIPWTEELVHGVTKELDTTCDQTIIDSSEG